MTISAVTLAAIGAAAVPTSRIPRVPIPISPAMTSRFVTFRRVLTVGANASLPSIAIVYATADVSSMVTVWPRTIRTTWLAVGTAPPQVEGLDQLPLCTDRADGRDVSREKSGMFSGRLAANVTVTAPSAARRSTTANRRAEKVVIILLLEISDLCSLASGAPIQQQSGGRNRNRLKS